MSWELTSLELKASHSLKLQSQIVEKWSKHRSSLETLLTGFQPKSGQIQLVLAGIEVPHKRKQYTV